MVEDVGRQVGSLPRMRNLFCFHHICAVLLLNSSSALLIADQRVSCKSTELDLVQIHRAGPCQHRDLAFLLGV